MPSTFIVISLLPRPIKNFELTVTTAVKLPCSTGYDKDKDFMENKVEGDLIKKGICVEEGNVSYVYSFYTYDTKNKTDITDRYTDLTNITIHVIDENNNPVENASIKVYSNNRYNLIYTELKETILENGEYTFTIGGGNYTFEAVKDDKYANKTGSFDEDIKHHNITIKINLI